MKKILIIFFILTSILILNNEIGVEYFPVFSLAEKAIERHCDSLSFSLTEEEIEESRKAVHLPYGTWFPINSNSIRDTTSRH